MKSIRHPLLPLRLLLSAFRRLPSAYCLQPTVACLLLLSEAGWRGGFEGLVGGPGEVRTLDLMTASHVKVVPGVDS